MALHFFDADQFITLRCPRSRTCVRFQKSSLYIGTILKILHRTIRVHARRSHGALQPYPLGPPLPQRPAAGAPASQRGEMGLEDPDSGRGWLARRSRAACSLQQRLLGRLPSGGAGGSCVCQSRDSKWTRERVQAEETVGAHTEKCGWGHRARTLWLLEYFFGAARRRRQERVCAKTMLVHIGGAAAPGVGLLRWKRFSDPGEVVRVQCGRAAKSAMLRRQCSRMLGAWARSFVACAERRT